MKLDTVSRCHYCHQEIDTDSDGWGGIGEFIVWHSECFQMNEGVDI